MKPFRPTMKSFSVASRARTRSSLPSREYTPALIVPSRGGGTKVICSPWGGASCATKREHRSRQNGSSLRIDAPIQIREQVVAPLAIFEKRLVDELGSHLVVETSETKEMILCAFRGVVFCRAGLHQECPV